MPVLTAHVEGAHKNVFDNSATQQLLRHFKTANVNLKMWILHRGSGGKSEGITKVIMIHLLETINVQNFMVIHLTVAVSFITI